MVTTRHSGSVAVMAPVSASPSELDTATTFPTKPSAASTTSEEEDVKVAVSASATDDQQQQQPVLMRNPQRNRNRRGQRGTNSKSNSNSRPLKKFCVRKPNTKFTKKNAEESVEVVKMLTGILYLYRGSHPRAEFVRKV